MDTLQQMGFLRLPQVLQLIPVSKSDWWEGVKSGIYPRRYKIGQKTVWRVKDILAFAEQIKPAE